MKNRIYLLVVFGWVAVLAAACAKPVVVEPLPLHPFPSWVSTLESGQTELEEVRERFGPPDEIEASVRGGTIWRYAFKEIDWPQDDPMRPVVAADGSVGPRTPSGFSRVGHGFRTAWLWIDRAIFFPPRQTRPPRTRRLPATVHHLELFFGVGGKLHRFRYTPTQGLASVPVRG